MARRAALSLLLLAAAAPALGAATSWRDEPAYSRLTWTAHWRHTAVSGEFRRFSVVAKLDPEAPAGGSFTVTIDTASAAAESPDISRAIRGTAWFDAAQYRRALFATSAIRTQAGGDLEVTGTLSLKGHRKQLAFPLQIERKGDRLILSGDLELDRRDFAVGTGAWSRASPIAPEVAVAFRVTLVRSE